MNAKTCTVLDIIQTAAVIIGVAIAVNELYVNDRAAQRIDDVRAFQVSSDLLDRDALKDFVEMVVVYVEDETRKQIPDDDRDALRNALREINIKSYPILGKISTIEKCVSNKLCNSAIVYEMTCETIQDIGAYLKKLPKLYKNTSEIPREAPLRRMLKQCADWSS